MTAIGPQEGPEPAADPHRAHHGHLKGRDVFCSCGLYLAPAGVLCPPPLRPVAPGEQPLSCSVCGEAGVTWTGG